MALTQEQKTKLEQVSSFAQEAKPVGRRAQATTVPTIVIGLGGLGGETVNTLKHKLISKVDAHDSVQFIAVDTAQAALDYLSSGEPGTYLEKDETFLMFDPSIQLLLMNGEENVPAYIKAWLSPDMLGTKINNQGAMGNRQLGKLMLLAGETYTRLENRIRRSLAQALRTADAYDPDEREIEIIIAAGVAGGTGGGAIVDLAYMIRRIVDELGLAACTQLSAYLYLPDALLDEPGIQGREPIAAMLKKAGQATLKDIDYYMNLMENKGQYVTERSGKEEYTSRRDVFDACYLIADTSREQKHSKANAVEMVTEHLMDLSSDITYMSDEGLNHYAEPFGENNSAKLGSWFITNGSDEQMYPRDKAYRYNLLRYASVEIPENAIRRYCVDAIFNAYTVEYRQISEVTEDMLTHVLKLAKVSNIDELREAGLESAGVGPLRTSISVGEDKYPAKKEIRQFKDSIYKDAVRLANVQAKKVINEDFKAQMASTIIDELSLSIGILFLSYGPYYAVEFMTHKKYGDANAAFSGILYHLNEMKEIAEKKSKVSSQYGNTNRVRKAIEEARKAATGLFAGKKEIGAYADLLCEVAAESAFEAQYYDSLADILGRVSTQLTYKNNQIWDVYTRVMDAVSRMAEKDDKRVATIKNKGTTYSFQPNEASTADETEKQLQAYMNQTVSGEVLTAFTDAFIEKVRYHKDEWIEKQSENLFDADDEIQKIFGDLYNSEIGNEIIERFMVAAYSPKQLTAKEIDKIWKSDEQAKNEVVKAAAGEIYNILEQEARFSADFKMGYYSSRFSGKEFIVTPEQTPLLSKALSSMYGGRMIEKATDKSTAKFICSDVIYGLPLFVIEEASNLEEE